MVGVAQDGGARLTTPVASALCLTVHLTDPRDDLNGNAVIAFTRACGKRRMRRAAVLEQPKSAMPKRKPP